MKLSRLAINCYVYRRRAGLGCYKLNRYTCLMGWRLRFEWLSFLVARRVCLNQKSSIASHMPNSSGNQAHKLMVSWSHVVILGGIGQIQRQRHTSSSDFDSRVNHLPNKSKPSSWAASPRRLHERGSPGYTRLAGELPQTHQGTTKNYRRVCACGSGDKHLYFV